MTISKDWLSDMMEKATADGKVAYRIVYDKHVQRAKGQSGISKAWLTDLIRNESVPERRIAFQTCFEKLTEPIVKTDGKQKEIDHNKVYENILLYYINHGGKTPEEAHVIAQKVVEEQKQKQKVLDGF
jgi:hypothetical protein